MKNRIHLLLILFITIVSCNQKVSINSLDDIYSEIGIENQQFEILGNKESIIECREGTKILIPKHTFKLPNGEFPDSSLVIQVKECYSISSFLLENLSTMSSNQILESGGMINVTASYKGDSLLIDKNKALVISMPTKKKKSKMNLFFGNRKENGSIDWSIDKEGSKINKATSSENIKKEYRYMTILSEWHYWYTPGKADTTINIGTHPLVGTDNNLTEYIKNFQFLDNEYVKLISENDSNKIKVKFRINESGDFYNIKVISSETEVATEKIIKYFDEFPHFDLLESGLNPEYWFDWILTLSASYDIDKEKYNRAFNNKYSKYKTSVIDKMNISELNNYVFTATQLGWINCDRFWDYNGSKIDFVVNTLANDKTDVKIIFEGIQSIMQGIQIDDKIVFRNVPEGLNVKIIGLTYENNQPLLAVEKTKIQSGNYELKAFSSFTLDELEKELKKIKN